MSQCSSGWTYSGNPGYSTKDAVRFLIGDTNIKDPLLLDGEIEYLLQIYNDTPMNAAIRACESIMTKFARLADETVGQVKINFSQKAKDYASMQIMLRNRLAMEDAPPYAGGISASDKYTQTQNKDRVRPDFTKHMMENDQIAPWTTETEQDLWLALDD